MTTEKLPLANPFLSADLVDQKMVLASRHAECLKRLSTRAARVSLHDLANHLQETSSCIDRFAYELATTESGAVVLARAARLVTTAERILAKRERQAVVH